LIWSYLEHNLVSETILSFYSHDCWYMCLRDVMVGSSSAWSLSIFSKALIKLCKLLQVLVPTWFLSIPTGKHSIHLRHCYFCCFTHTTCSCPALINVNSTPNLKRCFGSRAHAFLKNKKYLFKCSKIEKELHGYIDMLLHI
jgi:hypothetical protein